MLSSTPCFAMQDTSSGVIWHCNLYQAAAVILPAFYACPFCHGGVKISAAWLKRTKGQCPFGFASTQPGLVSCTSSGAGIYKILTSEWLMGIGTHLGNRLCLHLWDFLQTGHWCSVLIVGVDTLNYAFRLPTRFGPGKSHLIQHSPPVPKSNWEKRG